MKNRTCKIVQSSSVLIITDELISHQVWIVKLEGFFVIAFPNEGRAPKIDDHKGIA